VIHRVAATAARSSLEVLAPAVSPFSQVGLLTVDELLKAAKQRQITMWAGRDLDITCLSSRLRIGSLPRIHPHGLHLPTVALHCVHLLAQPARTVPSLVVSCQRQLVTDVGHDGHVTTRLTVGTRVDLLVRVTLSNAGTALQADSAKPIRR
jgi:hypothetical protein